MFNRLLSILTAVVLYANAVDINLEKITPQPTKIKLDVYYESLCPDCRHFFQRELVPLMQQPLHQYIDLHLYPYGKARKIYDQNGTYTLKCQHGPHECYGNKLHACAIDLLPSDNLSLFNFTSCLMAHHSNDAAADLCAKELNIDPEPIKACAAADKGSQLLKHYGEETGKISFTWVPHVMIDEIPMDHHRKIMSAVCDVLKKSSTACTEYYKKVYSIIRNIFFI